MRTNRQRDRDALWMALAVAVLCAVGFVFAEWIPTEIVLRAQLFRSTRWLTVLILAYTAGGLARPWSGGRAGRVVALAAGASLFLAGGAKAFPYVLAPVLLLLPPLPRLPAWCLGLNAAAVAAYAMTSPHAEHPGNVLAFLLNAGGQGRGIVLGILLLALVAAWRMRAAWARAAIIAAVLGTALIGVLPRLHRADHPPLEERGGWVRLQLWARAHTTPDAVFLTPPSLPGFRVYSERSTLVEWKDGTQQFFDPAYSEEWWERMRKVGGRDPDRYETLTAAQLIALRDEFGITHAVFSDSKVLPFPVVHAADGFRVFRLLRRSGGDPHD